MPEEVIVRQNKDFRIGYWASDAHQPGSDELIPVEKVYDLSPFTMLLASLGACTTIVLHTYAQNHSVDLEQVEIHLEYRREQPRNNPTLHEANEKITQSVAFAGQLSPDETDRLFTVAQQCSIHHLLKKGITIESHRSEIEAKPL